MSIDVILGIPFIVKLERVIDWRERALTNNNLGKNVVLSTIRPFSYAHFFEAQPELGSHVNTSTKRKHSFP